jgi:hypothetical protein
MKKSAWWDAIPVRVRMRGGVCVEGVCRVYVGQVLVCAAESIGRRERATMQFATQSTGLMST